MIKIERTEVFGWEAAIRGMRNPKNSWHLSDTVYGTYYGEIDGHKCIDTSGFCIGPNDKTLMKSLIKGGKDHAKFMRMIHVQVDVTAPLYWWKEYDTYKVATVANSCSTMHKLTAKEFALEDFSLDKIKIFSSYAAINSIIMQLNSLRKLYLYGGPIMFIDGTETYVAPRNKDIWDEMIQLLPTSYNQKRTLDLNYATLRDIYFARRNHKLEEWHEFCDWIKTLPYSELITLEEE